MRPRVHCPARLALESMEERLTPAFTLTIDGDVASSANVFIDSSSFPGVTVFTAIGTGAVLDVDAVEAALDISSVVITTGPLGTEAGSIVWNRDSSADDLDYLGPALRNLVLRTEATATAGNFTATDAVMNFADNVNLTIDTTAPATDGFIDPFAVSVNAARNITLRAGTANIFGGNLNLTALGGNVNLVAADVVGSVSARSVAGNVTVNARVNSDLTARADAGTVEVNRAVNGSSNLSLYGKDVVVAADIGTSARLASVTFAGGDIHLGTHTVQANEIFVGDFMFETYQPTLAGTGTLVGDVFVLPDGTVAPGGVGSVGTLTVDGTLTFNGGTYSVDLGPVSDQLDVIGTGDVDILFGQLGDGRGTGTLSGTADVSLIQFTGLLTGSFSNAPAAGAQLLLGFEAVQLTNYGPSGTGVTVARLASDADGVVTGSDFDGTAYTVRLTGGGELVGLTNFAGGPELVLRGTGPLSKVTITTRRNASDDLILMGTVRINGGLASFSAPGAQLFGSFAATGAVSSLTFGQVSGSVVLGGTATDKTAIKAEGIAGSITTPGVVSAITARDYFGAGVTAAGVGTVKVGGPLFGSSDPWSVTGGIGSITAGDIQSLRLTARNIGTLKVVGSQLLHLSGSITNSTITLTGNDGTTGKFAIKSLVAKGRVEISTIDAEEGNVGTVVVGRFINSNLYVDYTPLGAFDTGGDFNSAANFKLANFRTTALPMGNPGNPFNWAFADSQIAADTIGTVRLSGLNTGGMPFGIKFRTSATSVQAKTAGPATVPLNVNLTPGSSPIAGGFFFLDV
jgi:hypothetical protein